MYVGADFSRPLHLQSQKCSALSSDRAHGRVDSGPQVHRIQLFTTAGLQVYEQLRAVGCVSAEHGVDEKRSASCPSAEHLDLDSEVCVGHGTKAGGVRVALGG